MNPTLYDILGVSPDASRDEVRKAWREAADRFEPGEGGSTKQFRLFNQAAEVLLDPEKRKEYDAQLGRDGTAGDGTDKGRTTTGVALEKESSTAPPPLDVPIPGSSAVATASTTAVVPPTVVEDAPAPEADRTGGRALPWWVLAVLGVLTALAVGVAAFLVVRADRAEAYQESLNRAPAAAESAAAAVLSYKYDSLEADRDAAAKFLSDSYRKQYVATFDKLVKTHAPQEKATVEAQVLGSSAMVVGQDRDPDRVPVLLFVNQTTTSTANGGQPSVALNRVRFDMVKQDGTWYVDGITSY